MQTILDKNQLHLTIQRLAHQLVENHPDIENVALIGIQTGGIYLADKIVDVLKEIQKEKKILYGKLDITFYRDDIRKELHVPNQTLIPFSIENKKVVLIDDVLFTGRTIRAAMDALQDFGRPQKVELCVLIDRKSSRQLPIQPDYYGKAIDSIISEIVKVKWDREEVVLF
jgi:pyrimidine operon attenuation protein/uracil phosphoribosyltransferase